MPNTDQRSDGGWLKSTDVNLSALNPCCGVLIDGHLAVVDAEALQLRILDIVDHLNSALAKCGASAAG
jgi:hypothetical protein